jgi:putative membrane protein
MMLGTGHVFVFLGTVLFWIGLIVLIIWAVRTFANRQPVAPPTAPKPLTPREILDERLARGEITVEVYEANRATLER